MSKKSSAQTAPRSNPTAPVGTRSNPAEASNATQLQPPTKNGVPDTDAVRARAHALWEQAGRPGGDGVEFWLRADQELSNPR